MFISSMPNPDVNGVTKKHRMTNLHNSDNVIHPFKITLAMFCFRTRYLYWKTFSVVEWLELGIL